MFVPDNGDSPKSRVSLSIVGEDTAGVFLLLITDVAGMEFLVLRDGGGR